MYKEITFEEYNRFRPCDFTDDFIKYFKKLENNTKINIRINIHQLNIYKNNSYDFFSQFFIYVDNDEWYYVNNGYNNYYKCDQLDGLIKFLISKGIYV